ncbi:hypothetical protein H0H92_007988 [Tricholoma furcatifolium]|nr:hypothetical protein H0H92_007988 [Tricholoma furcatifolium]
MIFNATSLSTFLYHLSLTQGTYKPIPATDSSGLSIFNTPSSYAAQGPPKAQILLGSPQESPPLPKASENNCHVEPYSAPPVEKQTFSPYDSELAKIYQYRQQQSVNLGSWFVHENWMTPSLFECANEQKLSELDIASGWGSLSNARAVLERHWDTFITQKDFQYLASIGINTVRLPIGYWNLGPSFCQDTPFAAVAEVYQNSWPRIVRTINWAAESGIGVLVDLHGAVGSQNGQPHSGISDGASNMFSNPEYLEKTILVLEYLMCQLDSVTNIVGLQLLNEPNNVPELADVYTRMIKRLRRVTSNSNSATVPLYVHDGFDLERFSEFVSNRTDFIVEDHHSYFVFTPSDRNESASDHTGDVRGSISDLYADTSSRERRNLVIDEWSCALDPASLAQESDQDQARRDFCKGQMDVYTNATAGWCFWCKSSQSSLRPSFLIRYAATAYLKEDCDNDPGWCFKAAIGDSLPEAFFSYDNTPTDPQCVRKKSSLITNMSAPSASDILANQPDASDDPTDGPSRRGESSLKEHVSRQYRFEAIRRRHRPDTEELTPSQRSIVKGYTDGFLTSKEFASSGQFAKLGFIGQWLATKQPVDLEQGTEQDYRRGFVQGLTEGQGRVQEALSEPHC